MSYVDKAEVTREYYRKQGEQRERERIIQQLQRLLDHKPGESWSPRHLIQILKIRQSCKQH
jgi:hypothetical protein